MTNATAGAYADLPLFGFHILEYLDVDYEIDIDESTAAGPRRDDRHVEPAHHQGARRPGGAPGRDTADGDLAVRPDGTIRFGRWGNDWHSIVDEDEAFFLRVLAPGDYRYKGADLGILVSRSRMQTESAP